VLLALWSALGILSNLNGAFLAAVTFGALVVRPPAGRRRLLPIAVALAGVGLVFLPWAMTYFHLFEFGRLVPGRAALPEEMPLRAVNFAWPAVPYTFYAFSVGYTLGPSLRELHAHTGLAALRPHALVLALTALAFGGLALAGLKAMARRTFALALLGAALFLPMAAVVYFALQNFKTFHPRYLAVGFPGWIVLLAAGYVALPRAPRAVLGALAVALCAVSLAHHAFDPAYGKEDFRGATAYLASHLAPGDSLVATGGHAPMAYYWRNRLPGDRLPAARSFWLGYARDRHLEPHFEPFVNRTGGATWVVVSRPEDDDPAGRFDPWLRTQFHPETRDFPGVRLYRIPPQGPAR
jgi:FtsH-binding integral membrane protein